MSEEWKPIKDYESLYEISNIGKIRSIDKIVNVSNNRIENLEWCTKSYNTKDAWRNGLINIPKGNKNKMYGKFGKKANASKSVYQYDKNMNFIKKWNCQKDIERELGYKQSCISNCIIGNSESSYGYIWRLKYEG
jgi:hypothetical protein